MNPIKKLLLGTAIASTLLIAVPAQDADAASIEFTPPNVEFYYQQPGGSSSWFYQENTDYDKAGSELSGERNITYVTFDVSNSVFAQPGFSTSGTLSLGIKEVETSSDFGTLQVFRTIDQAVLDAKSEYDFLTSLTPKQYPAPINSGVNPPIAFGDLLGSEKVYDFMDQDPVTFEPYYLDIALSEIQAQFVDDVPYISFAITGNDSSISFLKANTGSFKLTPVPEPMSASYMLLGAVAFAFRRIKKAALGMFGLA